MAEHRARLRPEVVTVGAYDVHGLPARLAPARSRLHGDPAVHTGAAAQLGTAAGETAPSGSRRRTVARVVAA
ncbi:hypothetical protein ACWKT5_27095 [Streptomyces avermitilis]